MFQDLHIEIPSGRIPVQEEWAWAYMYFCMRAGQIHHAQLVYEQELTWDMDVSEKQQLGQALQQYRTFPNNRPEQPPHIPNANTLRDFDKFGGKFKMRVYVSTALSISTATTVVVRHAMLLTPAVSSAPPRCWHCRC